MKKILIVLLISLFSVTSISFAKSKKKSDSKNAYSLPTALAKDIKEWDKDKLEYLSSVYYELGKRFFELKKTRDSKACFYYAIQVYPIGKPAQAAKEQLKKNFEIDIP